MNYLAHAFLSFGDPGILVGNMISDFVKGKKKFDYAKAVQQGIMLHRQIDEYTDQHPATREAIRLLQPACGRYAGSFMDIVYDHFLANDAYEFPEGALARFASTTYRQLEAYQGLLPVKFDRFLYHMRTQNWLLNYQSPEGIYHSFEGLIRRAKYITNPDPPFQAFQAHFEELKNCYELFFPNLKSFTYNELLHLKPEN